MPGLVGADRSFAQQGFPLVAWQAAIVEIGPRPFAAMVEETDVVVLLLQRLDFPGDKIVQFIKIGQQVLGERKIHFSFLPIWPAH